MKYQDLHKKLTLKFPPIGWEWRIWDQAPKQFLHEISRSTQNICYPPLSHQEVGAP